MTCLAKQPFSLRIIHLDNDNIDARTSSVVASRVVKEEEKEARIQIYLSIYLFSFFAFFDQVIEQGIQGKCARRPTKQVKDSLN